MGCPCVDPAINPNDIHISDLAQFSAELFSAPLGLACLLRAARGEDLMYLTDRLRPSVIFYGR